MKRFIFSALSIVLAAGVAAPSAQALPQVDAAFKLQSLRLSELDARNKADFKLQTLRLSEFDARNKAEEGKDAYVPYGEAASEASEWTEPQNESAEEENVVEAEATATEDVASEADAPTLSVTERRQQVLDRS